MLGIGLTVGTGIVGGIAFSMIGAVILLLLSRVVRRVLHNLRAQSATDGARRAGGQFLPARLALM
jgi:hypothetical protein